MGVVRADPFIAVRARHPVTVVNQDVADVAVLAGTDLQGQRAGRLQADLAIALGQLEKAEASAVAVLWMPVFPQQPCTHTAAAGRSCPPVDHALRRPFHVGAVRRRHLSDNGAEAADAAFAGMAGDTLSSTQQFDCCSRDVCFQRLTHQRMRHAVAMFLHRYVIINVYLDGLEGSNLVAPRGHCLDRRGVQRGERARPAARQLLEGAFVELLEHCAKRTVVLTSAAKSTCLFCAGNGSLTLFFLTSHSWEITGKVSSWRCIKLNFERNIMPGPYFEEPCVINTKSTLS